MPSEGFLLFRGVAFDFPTHSTAAILESVGNDRASGKPASEKLLSVQWWIRFRTSIWMPRFQATGVFPRSTFSWMEILPSPKPGRVRRAIDGGGVRERIIKYLEEYRLRSRSLNRWWRQRADWLERRLRCLPPFSEKKWDDIGQKSGVAVDPGVAGVQEL